MGSNSVKLLEHVNSLTHTVQYAKKGNSYLIDEYITAVGKRRALLLSFQKFNKSV